MTDPMRVPEADMLAMLAAMEMFESSKLQHRAMCWHAQSAAIETARQRVHDALDTLLDAQEAVQRAQRENLRRRR